MKQLVRTPTSKPAVRAASSSSFRELPAAGLPGFEEREFGGDGGVGTVAGVDDGVGWVGEEVADRRHDRGEVGQGVAGAGEAGAAGEEGVAGEEMAGEVQGQTAGGVAGGGNDLNLQWAERDRGWC